MKRFKVETPKAGRKDEWTTRDEDAKEVFDNITGYFVNGLAENNEITVSKRGNELTIKLGMYITKISFEEEQDEAL